MSVTPKKTLRAAPTDHERRVEGMIVGYGQSCPDTPTVGSVSDRIFRARIKLEEALEYIPAAGLRLTCQSDGYDKITIAVEDPFSKGTGGFEISVDPKGKPDLVKIADALSDDSVVNTGGFIMHGLRMVPFLEITDNNNLLKIATGKLDEHGKFQKSPNHPPPDYSFELALQGYDPATDPHLPRRPPLVSEGEVLEYIEAAGAESTVIGGGFPEDGGTGGGPAWLPELPGTLQQAVSPYAQDKPTSRTSSDDTLPSNKLHRLRRARTTEGGDALIYSGILVDAIMATMREEKTLDAAKLLALSVFNAGYAKRIEINTPTIRLTLPGEPGERGVYFQYRRLE